MRAALFAALSIALLGCHENTKKEEPCDPAFMRNQTCTTLPCEDGLVCRLERAAGCASSRCWCDPGLGPVCYANCGPGVCMRPQGGVCSGPTPEGCARRGCPAGQACSTDPRHGCLPSRCVCDPLTGWFCNTDCSGGICVPEAGEDTPTCDTPSPAGCTTEGCPVGFTCSLAPEAGCKPSSCHCEANGSWGCSGDCLGGVCVPSP